jgi:hypothetical protein
MSQIRIKIIKILLSKINLFYDDLKFLCDISHQYQFQFKDILVYQYHHFFCSLFKFSLLILQNITMRENKLRSCA